MSNFLALIKKIDRFLDRHTGFCLLFALIIILRIPNFFEPYWYGDEAIYLTLGHALNQGEKLYTTIIDHKTPLIYYLAMVPNQFYFRLLNLFWMLATTSLFFFFAKTLFKKESLAVLASIILIIFTTLPWLEGHLPNGELFVMGFIMAGAILFTRTSVFSNFISGKINLKNPKSENLLLLGSGMLMGLGVLTKVPAILDVAAFIAIAWLILVNQFFKHKNLGQIFMYLVSKMLFFGGGVLIALAASILYFVLRGQGADYLDYGLLYNFRYSQSWSHDFGSSFLNFAFSLIGKTLFLIIFVMLISLNVNQLSKRLQFIAIWFVAALYSVLLSSRPYPHYFIQMVPAFALLSVEMILSFGNFLKQRKIAAAKPLLVGISLYALTLYIMLSFGFMPYETAKYYQQFYRFATGQISRESYENSFDSLVAENRQVTTLIKEMGVERMFIWGTNPLLYAQSKTIPTSRFTVSFHIKDFNDYDRTFAQIEAEAPKLIIVMKNETQEFPALSEYLAKHYISNHEYQYMILYWRK